MHQIACGAVRVKLLRRAFFIGIDPETGLDQYSYEALPSDIQATVNNSNPLIIAKLEGAVPLIGLNLMGAWGLQAHAHRGLIKCTGDQFASQDVEV